MLVRLTAMVQKEKSSVLVSKNKNVRHFEMVEATGFNSMESRSFSMPSPPYKISSKTTERFKSY
jgi:hypothetical protein